MVCHYSVRISLYVTELFVALISDVKQGPLLYITALINTVKIQFSTSHVLSFIFSA